MGALDCTSIFGGGLSRDLYTNSQVLFHFWIRIPYNRSAFKGKKQPGQLQQDGIVAVVRVGVTRNNRATYSNMGSSLSYARLSEVVSESSGCVFGLKVLSKHEGWSLGTFAVAIGLVCCYHLAVQGLVVKDFAEAMLIPSQVLLQPFPCLGYA